MAVDQPAATPDRPQTGLIRRCSIETARGNPAMNMNRRELLRCASAGALATTLLGQNEDAAAATDANVFEDTVVDRGDAILSVRTIGTGDLVLIHPSLGRGARDFDPLARLIAAGGYRVASFDPRAIGQSTTPTVAQTDLTFADYAQDMLAVLHTLGARRAHLMGHALGNRITRTLATMHPGVARTVTLCACGGGSVSPKAAVGIAQVLSPTTPVRPFKAVVKTTFFASSSDPKPWYVGWYGSGGQEESKASALAPTSAFEAGGGRPMLIIQGLEDIVAPPSIGRALRRRYGSRVELHDLKRCGHALIIERPTEIAAIMLDYFARHSSAQRQK